MVVNREMLLVLFLFSTVAISVANPVIKSENAIDGEDEDVIDLSEYGNKIFGLPSNETGKVVAAYNPDKDDVNPEELGSYLEGDMLIPQGMGRNGLTAVSSRWPNAVIPYEIRGNFGKNSFLVFVI